METSWLTTLSLVFGGCCSNAVTLEQLTSEYPQAGSLVTFLQFIVISLHGIPRHVVWTRTGPRFKPRRIPLTPYLIQVALFCFISLLNNAAFAYHIPMAVHIIFRSGGLVISMTLGWLVGKRYSRTQILSVVLVTFGVVLTTLSASGNVAGSHTKATTGHTYATGIAILTFALLLSGALGLVQDEIYAKHGRPSSRESGSATWQESMFYLHFLALPMFIFLQKDLRSQSNAINAGPCFTFTIPLPAQTNFDWNRFSFISVSPSQIIIHIPNTYLLLLINTLTQLLCVAGVHRLTTRVSALTVTLVLVVRKAASLVLSVLGLSVLPGWGARAHRERRVQEVDVQMICVGATMVLLGTIGYASANGKGKDNSKNKKE